jgi:CheY-like chemotaxis protein
VFRCGGAPSPTPKRRGSARPASAPPRSVLVIDDDSTIRMLCRINLVAGGIDVLEAADGESGIAVARRERPDLVLLDVMMPGIDGWEVARRLAADPQTRDIPVVFLTARAGEEDRRQGANLGGAAYVAKPFDPVHIGDLVEEVLARVERGERDLLERDLRSRPPETM